MPKPKQPASLNFGVLLSKRNLHSFSSNPPNARWHGGWQCLKQSIITWGGKSVTVMLWSVVRVLFTYQVMGQRFGGMGQSCLRQKLYL